MGTIVGLEELKKFLDLDLVFIAQERRRVAIRSSPNARGVKLRALNAIISQSRPKPEDQAFRTAIL
jgi:hypothetical protein